MQTAWVITFYSFKGGTGRTLALTNVGRYLADERGYRVGLIDLDLESPGLSHEPLTDKIPAEGLRDAIDQSTGFMETFLAIVQRKGQLAEEVLTSANAAVEKNTVVIGSEASTTGSIVLMPAGRGSVSRSGKFRETLSLFSTVATSLNNRDRTSILFSIVRELISRYYLDYVLIDGRTGVGSLFPSYAYSLPHCLVLLTGLNEQSIRGSLGVLQERRTRRRLGDAELDGFDDESPPAPVFLAVSPIPTVGPELLEDRIEYIRETLRKLRAEREALRLIDRDIRFIYELPEGPDFLFPYTDLATYEEVYLPKRFPNAQLSKEYVRLAGAIENLLTHDAAGGNGKFSPKVYDVDIRTTLISSLAKPIRIAAENIFLEALRDHFLAMGLKEVPCSERFRTERSSAESYVELKADQLDSGGVILEFWSATDRQAPWERLVKGVSYEDEDRLPDVVTAPQSGLGDLVTESFQRIRFLEEERRIAGPLPSYGWLDAWYPGWRTWCTSSGRVVGLPFSMNTTLLCGNVEYLAEIQSLALGESVPGTLAGSWRLPASWNQMRDVWTLNRLASEKHARWPVLMAFEGRALYYEWMNIILALGGSDVQVGEGTVILDRAEPTFLSKRVAIATLVFLDLARGVLGRGGNEWSGEQLRQVMRMDRVVQEFGAGKVGMYVGWTDSVRFDQLGRKVRTAKLETVEGGAGGDGRNQSQLALGRVPRDVRWPRRPLVANWVTVFTKKDTRSREEVQLILEVMSEFLGIRNQERLLRTGFPCSSLSVVTRELERLRAKRERKRDLFGSNYYQFLLALEDALRDGHLVPWFPRSSDWMEAIAEELMRLITHSAVGDGLEISDIRRWQRTVYDERLESLFD